VLEIEQKFRVADLVSLCRRIEQMQFQKKRLESHIDVYLRHPARDFAVSGEAFRLRQIDDELFVTYKGKRHDAEIKIRPEIELPVGGNVEQWIELFSNLGFSIADEVRKKREVFSAEEYPNLVLVVDRVQQLGDFVEIEVLANEADKESAVSQILAVAKRLELSQAEPRSYLRQILELKAKS
jgi:adenylate cyclase class 2